MSSISVFLVIALLVLIFNNFYINQREQIIGNMGVVFFAIIPAIIVIIIMILLISLYLSHVLSSQILKPINYVGENIESLLIKNELNTLNLYDELIPFVRALVVQSEEIKAQLGDIAERKDITKTIITNMKEGLVFVDNDRNILSINKSAIDILDGIRDFSYKDKSFITICRNASLNLELKKVLKEDRDYEKIIELNGKYIYFFINKVFSEKKSLGAIILMLDYTQNHKVDRIRKEFSANVSHELKTPLTSINGYAEMIETGTAKGEDIKKFAAIIRGEGDRLLELINSIIKLSKIEDEVHNKDFQDIDLYRVSLEVLEELDFMAIEKDIHLKLIGFNTQIKANKIMIKELIYNLVDNAIKYTPAGGDVRVEISSDLQNTFLRVKDTGIGINEEDKGRIFERFFMVDKSRTKNKDSTGLGLSIVKHIVEYHGFNISVVSEVHKGCEFIISI